MSADPLEPDCVCGHDHYASMSADREVWTSTCPYCPCENFRAASPVPVGPTLTPEVVTKLAAECDRVGSLWEHVQERMQEAQAALWAVGAPYSPETTNPLYYPLLFLLKSVEAYHRDE